MKRFKVNGVYYRLEAWDVAFVFLNKRFYIRLSNDKLSTYRDHEILKDYKITKPENLEKVLKMFEDGFEAFISLEPLAHEISHVFDCDERYKDTLIGITDNE